MDFSVVYSLISEKSVIHLINQKTKKKDDKFKNFNFIL